MLKHALIVCFFASLVLFTIEVQGYGEAFTTEGVPYPVPTWNSRSILLLLNMLRVNPQQYRDTYALFYDPSIANILQGVQPQPLFQLDNGLIASTSYHTHDIGTTPNCAVGPVSCNGTTPGDRTAHYYCGNAALMVSGGGNIFRDPLYTMAYLLCQRQNTSDDTSPCKPDSDPNLPRTAFVSGAYQVAGAGFYYNDTFYTSYSTIDVGDRRCPIGSTYTRTLYHGSHFFNNSDTVIIFGAVYAASAAPRNNSVIIDGVAHPMTLNLGTTTQGAYILSQPANTTCREYYFIFQNADGSLTRFPDTGVLVTYGEGNCEDTFRAGPGLPTTSTGSTTTTGTTSNVTTGTTGTTTSSPTSTGGATLFTPTTVSSSTTNESSASYLTASATLLLVAVFAVLF